MLNSWFGSKSSRRSQPRQTHFNSPPVPDNVQTGHSDVSSLSQSTIGPLRTPPNLTSTSDVPLGEVHTHVNDPSLYATTPSLIHSTEKEAATLRTSDPPTTIQDAVSYQHDSVQRVFLPDRTLFTPQDAILAQVFGKSASPAADPARGTPPPSNAAQQSLATSDSLPPSSSARPGLTLPLYDPFSGTKLGEHTPVSSATTTRDLSSFAPIPTVDDRKQWSSLERILELQAEVAAMHADMEGVGGRGPGNHTGIASVGVAEGGHVGSGKRTRRGQTLPVGDEEPEEPEPEGGASTGAAISEISTDHSDGEDEDEDEEDDDNIHEYGKKRRDEEFARLAEQFAQRKAAIGGIMNKLDDLSTALKAFHALPPPLFDLAASSSRTDTLSSVLSATPPSHPLHLYPRQTSSRLPSISPSQAVSSIAHPAPPFTPPVPPISTLAPSISLSASAGLVPIVAPVLPRAAVPTIIPGAPHMESPADMEPRQSIFQGMSRASG